MPAPRNIEGKAEGARWTPRHEMCWAKTTLDGQPGISVRDHSLNVGCVAEALLDLLPEQLRALLPTGAATLAALHDIGKVSPGFQRKCPAWLLAHPWPDALCEGDHAKMSQFTIRQILGKSNLEHWAAIVGAHHGRLKGRLSQEPWEEERQRLARELIGQFGPLPVQPAEDAVLWFTAGLITVSDWIGSDENRFLDKPWTIEERRRQARDALHGIAWIRIALKSSLLLLRCVPNGRVFAFSLHVGWQTDLLRAAAIS